MGSLYPYKPHDEIILSTKSQTRKEVCMKYVLVLDVAKGKSMVLLISSCGEVLIEPYEINHSINYFTNLLNRINKLKLDNISVIMESTGIYHRPIERFFLENNFKGICY